MKQQKQDDHRSFDVLATEYINLLNDLDVMRNWGKPQLEALYTLRIGKLQVDKLRKQLEVKALKRKIELMQASLAKEEAVVLSAIDLQVAVELAEAEQTIMREAAQVTAAQNLLANLETPERSWELRKVYRQLAKQLHPDVNPTVTDKQTEIWHLVTEAYAACDLNKLKALQLVYAKEIAAAEAQWQHYSYDLIELGMEYLKNGIRDLQEEIFQLRHSFPFTMEALLQDEDWVTAKVEKIKSELDELQAYQTKLQLHYEQLTQLI